MDDKILNDKMPNGIQMDGKISCSIMDIFSVSLWRDGRRLAAASADNSIQIWDCEFGKILNKLTGHSDSVLSVVWNNEGNKLASGSADGTIKIWNGDNGQLIATLTGHNDSVLSVAWNSEGT